MKQSWQRSSIIISVIDIVRCGERRHPLRPSRVVLHSIWHFGLALLRSPVAHLVTVIAMKYSDDGVLLPARTLGHCYDDSSVAFLTPVVAKPTFRRHHAPAVARAQAIMMSDAAGFCAVGASSIQLLTYRRARSWAFDGSLQNYGNIYRQASMISAMGALCCRYHRL